MRPTLRFDEIHVISDLHLGGRTGFQIFDASAPLVLLIEHLRTEQPEKNLALVINGDLVDFLAEAPATYFDPDGAVEKLDRIIADPAFAPVWESLKRFVATENRTLVINLGNHDLELALPWVRDHLLDVLAGGDRAARGRITLVFDGTGFRCEVGGAQILCVHGNEVDPWNIADYEAIRRIGQDVSFGRDVEPWIPNAGTRLVIEVMNSLKRDHPFLDLLKPEVEAVVPVLLALDPAQWEKVRVIGGTARRLVWDRFRMAAGFLGDEARPGGETAGPLPVPLAWAVGGPAAADTALALLDRAEERLGKVDPIELVAREEHEEYLGLWGAARRLIHGEPDSEVLRDALDKLQNDRSFTLDDEDATFKQLDARVGEEINFLLAGHTHLERDIRRRHGPGHYFNTGTWVRLIQLDKPALQDAAQFGRLFQAFKAGTMEALDSEPGLVQRRPAVASIWTDGPTVHSELRRVSTAGQLLTITPVSAKLTKR
jgi:UDP-2,3-diacylglucosamine pyrophosphatase LpxH